MYPAPTRGTPTALLVTKLRTAVGWASHTNQTVPGMSSTLWEDKGSRRTFLLIGILNIMYFKKKKKKAELYFLLETFPVPYKAASIILCTPHWVVPTLGGPHTGWSPHLQCSTEFTCSIVFFLHQTKFLNTGCLSAQAFDVNLMSHYEDEWVYPLALPFSRIHNLSQRNPS